ncbi:MAG: serine hydrolase domain-containing protein [Thermomicrobiales bacterium]
MIDRALRRHYSRRTFHKTALAGAAVIAAPIAGRPSPVSASQGTAMPMAGVPDALFAELDAFVGERMAALKIPGASIGVIAGNQEHAAGFGVTNLDHPLPVDADTLFQIGSTTKTYTGTAVMRLVEQSALDLDAPVRTWLPEFRVADPDVSANVRLRHLLTHSGGWLEPAVVETGDGDDALARFVAGMADLPQTAPLGEYFSYSNAGLCLAGRVIEAVTGQTYEAAIRELVLQPLGIERASFTAEEIMTEAFAVGHGAPPDDPDGAPVVLQPWALPRLLNPAGGLVASVSDELRYALFLLGDGTMDGTRILRAEGLRRMQTPLGPGGTVPALPVPFDAVGVTWQLWQRDGTRVLSHPGGTNGQMSTLSLVPERGFAVTLLTNAVRGIQLGFEVTDWALEQFLGLRQPPPAIVPVDRALRAEYASEYALPDGSQTIRVREEDGALRLEASGPGLAEILFGQPTIESPLRFVAGDRARVEFLWLTALTDFVRDDVGKVAWVRFIGRLVPRTG